ncbi:hypothetical protein AVEN_54764-1 [Araneus ventricosus]|uniref:Uncharacterized protein n=1 Tax=Araneus ventricosus TaxID=182803 RepID=A0A4Y2IYL2_ARAVE|nr:hypothetical protein AVEN_54764-1 [Araneus ventricosus]
MWSRVSLRRFSSHLAGLLKDHEWALRGMALRVDHCPGDLERIVVPSTLRFEATRGLFWDGPRNFEPAQMTRTTPELAPPFKLPRYVTRETLATTHDLTCTGPIHGGSSVECLELEPSAPKPTLDPNLRSHKSLN